MITADESQGAAGNRMMKRKHRSLSHQDRWPGGERGMRRILPHCSTTDSDRVLQYTITDGEIDGHTGQHEKDKRNRE